MTASRIRAALLVLLAVQVVSVVWFWAWEFPRPHQVEIGEASVLTVVLFSKSGLPLYTHATGLPLVLNPYGPIFEWLCARLPEVRNQPYFAGRAISISAILGVVVLVACWLRRRQAGWIDTVLAIALFTTTKPWILFGPLYRVDTLAVFLSVSGFFLAVSRRRAGAIAALAVFPLALSVKLTALAAPAAAVAYLWTADRKRALWLFGGLVLLLPGSVLALEGLTDGAYLFNAAFANAPSHWLKGLELPSRSALSMFWLLAIFLAVRRLGANADSKTGAVLLYAISSLLVAGLFATNPLSSWNYLMEFYVALAILTGLLLARLNRGEVLAVTGKRVLALLAIHAAVSLLISTYTIWETTRKVIRYQARYEHAYARIEPLVRDGRELIVLESPEGKDVLNALGRPNPVSVPDSVERRPAVQELIQRALARSEVDLVLVGPELESRPQGLGSRPPVTGPADQAPPEAAVFAPVASPNANRAP